MRKLRGIRDWAALCAAAALLSTVLSGCETAGMCPPVKDLASPSENLQPAESEGRTEEQAGEMSALKKLRPVLQEPSYPNGCEIASLATVLRYNGLYVRLRELSETYLPRQELTLSEQDVLTGPDPEQYYVGDPATEEGWYCFEQPLADAADACLAGQGSDLRASILTGAGMEELRSWLELGIPVIVWFTVDYGEPVYFTDFYWTLETGEEYIPYYNLHCLVLTAIEDDVCHLADPLAGVAEVDTGTFEEVYTQMGRRALVITAEEE